MLEVIGAVVVNIIGVYGVVRFALWIWSTN